MTDSTDQQTMNLDLRHFLDQAVATGVVWGLQHADGWALSPAAEDEDKLVLPLWTRKEDAVACAGGDWGDYQAEAIGLDDLLELWLPGLHDDGYRVGINWTVELEGVEVPPLELQADLEHTIEDMDPED